MLKLFAKLENSINMILAKIGGFLFILFLKLVPNIVLVWKDNFIKRIVDFKFWCIEKKYYLTQWCIKKFGVIKNWIIIQITLLKSIDWKKLFIHDLLEKYHSMQGNDGVFKKILSVFTFALSKIGQFFQGLSPKQLLSFVFISSSALLGGVNVYVNSQKIYNTETYRAPASIAEPEYKRPIYYKKLSRSVLLQAVVLPVFIEDKKSIKTITVDFELFTTTRFATKFLLANETQVRDYLLMTMEPIDSNFPIKTEEGKEIIKLKIQHELNQFLKVQRVEGEVEEVRLAYILGT